MRLRQTYLGCTATAGSKATKALRNQTFNHSIDIPTSGSACGEKNLAKGLFSKTGNNRFGNFGLVNWDGSDISADGGTKKGRMKARRTVAKRCVPYFFVLFDYTADFEGFKYQAAGLPAVA